MHRRKFIELNGIAASLLATGAFPWDAIEAPELFKLSILHTNDWHSRIDPIPDNGISKRFGGFGGAARRYNIIKQIRQTEKNVLLLDCGDIFQGTPYFNYFLGEIEINLMSKMGYDAATYGNHDFDGGFENLVTRAKQASFPFVNCNYNFDNTTLKHVNKPFIIKKYGNIKVGITGVGIDPVGLVPKSLFLETEYLDPISNANAVAERLKHDEKCDLVVCISHLGYKYGYDRVSDVVLAQSSRNIDIILGGHTHTFLDKPEEYKNLDGQPVIINQVGWGGVILGGIDVYFDSKKRKKCINCTNQVLQV